MTLPAYSPELNLVEHLWDELRDKHFHNRFFDSLEAVEEQLEGTLHGLELDCARARSPLGRGSLLHFQNRNGIVRSKQRPAAHRNMCTWDRTARDGNEVILFQIGVRKHIVTPMSS